MARVALDIPKVGLVMENARLVRWLKQVGDAKSDSDTLIREAYLRTLSRQPDEREMGLARQYLGVELA